MTQPGAARARASPRATRVERPDGTGAVVVRIRPAEGRCPAAARELAATAADAAHPAPAGAAAADMPAGPARRDGSAGQAQPASAARQCRPVPMPGSPPDPRWSGQRVARCAPASGSLSVPAAWEGAAKVWSAAVPRCAAGWSGERRAPSRPVSGRPALVRVVAALPPRREAAAQQQAVPRPEPARQSWRTSLAPPQSRQEEEPRFRARRPAELAVPRPRQARPLPARPRVPGRLRQVA